MSTSLQIVSTVSGLMTTPAWPLSRVSQTRLSREQGTDLCRLRNFLFDNGQASVEIILVKHREYSLGDDFQLEDWKDQKPQYDLVDSFGPSSAWWVLKDTLLRRHLAGCTSSWAQKDLRDMSQDMTLWAVFLKLHMCPKMKWQIGVIIAIINMSLMHTMLRSFSGGVCVIESVILTTPASR